MNFNVLKIKQASSVLICGKTDLLCEAGLDLLVSSYRTVVVGDLAFPTNYKRSQFRQYSPNLTEEELAGLFRTYSIDTICYISSFTDGKNVTLADHADIERLVRYGSENDISKLIVLTSMEGLNFSCEKNGEIRYGSAEAFYAKQLEDTVFHRCSEAGMKGIVLRVPNILAKGNNNTFIGGVFHKMKYGHGRKIVLSNNSEDQIAFCSCLDLAELLVRVIEESADESAAYNVPIVASCTPEELAVRLKELAPEAEISVDMKPFIGEVKDQQTDLRREYGFVPSDNALEMMAECYDVYKKGSDRRIRNRARKEKTSDILKSGVIPVLELILLAVLMEVIILATGNSIYFRFVDVRLFFVLIMGSIYGMNFGLLAGLIACVSLVYSYLSSSVTGTMLFYNIEYWLPFVLFLMTGAVTGYIRQSHDEQLEFANSENELLQDKYKFLFENYESVLENKAMYKKQILGYDDSFGKIYEAVSRLDSDKPEDVFMNGLGVLEKTLNNRSIAIYYLDDQQAYGRMMACSSSLLKKLPKSFALAEHAEMMNTLKKDEVWKNTAFLANEPMYAYGIRSNDKAKMNMIIAVYEATPEQQSLYYANLFRIMSDLIRISFNRAVEYQTAVRSEQYYEDTLFLKPEYMKEQLETQHKMADAGISHYMDIRFRANDIKELSEQLEGVVRAVDILGLDDDGKGHLLLTQATEEVFPAVRVRLNKKRIPYELVRKE